MELIDTHCHLDGFAARGELDAMLQRARQLEVRQMVTVGTGPEDWSLYRDLSAKHPGVIHYSVGLHPCHVEAGWESAVSQIESYWESPKAGAPLPVALGECGLDRFHLPKDAGEAAKIFAWQQAAFAAQLSIAKRVGAPLIVHSRGAFAESVRMIDESDVDWTRVVFHCFSEGEAEVLELKRRGGFASFTGILTYKNAANVRAAAVAQGLDRFMIETDAPYLAPAPHRGKPNEPGWVRHVAEFAAAGVFRVPLAEVAAISTANAKRFFGLR